MAQTTNTHDRIITQSPKLEGFMSELWKCVSGYCGLYQVSSIGRVRSVERFAKRSDGSLVFVKARIKKPQKLKMGYYGVSLSSKSKGKTFYIHRLVAMAFIDGFSGGLQVNHLDGDKLNNAVGNLAWCTPSENSQHAYDTGLSKSSLSGLTGVECANTKYSVIANNGLNEIRMTGNKDMINNGFLPSCINLCLSGKQKQHKGYFFKKEYL